MSAGRMIWGLISASGNRFFSSPKNVQAGSGDHPASYSMGTWDSFPGRKANST